MPRQNMLPKSLTVIRQTRRRFITHGLGAAAGLMLPKSLSAQSASQLSGRDPKTLIVAVDAAVDNLDPATNLEWAYGLQPIYDTLTKLKGASSSDFEPWLAKSFSSNKEFTVWTFDIRDGVKFHDGTPCNAAAVRRAIIRTVTLPTGIGFVWRIDDPEKQITLVGKNSLQFTFPAPRPLFGLEVSAQYGFGIASPDAAAEHSKGPEDLGTEWLKANPVGTGPYMVEAFEPGQQVVLKINPNYWGDRNGWHFDRVITQTVPVEATRRQLLEEGAVDIIWPLTAEDTVQLKKNERFVVSDAPTLTMQYVALGCYGSLADPRARQAINHAFDTKAFIRDVELATQDAPRGIFPSGLLSADPEVEVPAFDLRKARELLEAAGIGEGQELTYEYYTGYGQVPGELLQSWLSEIGIRLKLVEKSYSGFVADFFSDAPPEQRPNMYYFGWWPNINHPHSFAYPCFHSKSWGSRGGNAGYYTNKAVDDLIDAISQRPADDTELSDKSKKLQRILSMDDPPWLPVMQDRTQLIYRKDIKGLEINPVYVSTLDIHRLRREG